MVDISVLNIILTVIIAVLLFALIIGIHEFGHFITAKKFGVKVNEFALGMGPKIWSKQGKETMYSLRLIPIGGYCAMEGEDEDSDDERAINNKKWWKRAIIISAGAVMNILLGIVFMFIIQVQQPYYASTTVAYLVSDSTSMNAGIQVDDEIYSINGYRTLCATDMSFALSTAKDGVLDIVVKRNGEKLAFNDLQMEVVSYSDGVAVTNIDFKVYRVDKTVKTVITSTFSETLAFVRMIYSSFIMLFKGQVGFNELSGPVGMATAIGQVAEQGFAKNFLAGLNNIIYFMALITVNLGIFNLLPIPALDGGRLFFILVEAVRGKPISPEKEGIVHFIGFALLILLMIAVTIKDVWSLF
ncbi:MAG: M50 family metallopeptidase [Acutalibacteraceae bacterium]|nr:M50 family metallopeptidase [Bacillota bacterium]